MVAAKADIGSTSRITFGSESMVNSANTDAVCPSEISWSKISTARLIQ